MAIGAALLFNIKLPINFNSPYKALDIQDFWRRWHITLSRFLRDYIYIPLGGNRKGSFRTYNNLLATFILGGIWHGAGWTFVFWGFLHGIALVIHRFWKELGFAMPKVLAWFITFNFINIAWVFFRAREWNDALKVLDGMFSLDNIFVYNRLEKIMAYLPDNFNFGNVFIHLHENENPFWWILIIFIFILPQKNSNQLIERIHYSKKELFIVLVCFVYSVLNFSHVSEFLYFNF